jgi:hypothetical protein
MPIKGRTIVGSFMASIIRRVSFFTFVTVQYAERQPTGSIATLRCSATLIMLKVRVSKILRKTCYPNFLRTKIPRFGGMTTWSAWLLHTVHWDPGALLSYIENAAGFLNIGEFRL